MAEKEFKPDTLPDQEVVIEDAPWLTTDKLDASISVRWISEETLTTKWDLLTYSTEKTRLPVWANWTVPIADSAEATWIKWGSAPKKYYRLLDETTWHSWFSTWNFTITSWFEPKKITLTAIRPWDYRPYSKWTAYKNTSWSILNQCEYRDWSFSDYITRLHSWNSIYLYRSSSSIWYVISINSTWFVLRMNSNWYAMDLLIEVEG